MAPDVSIHYGRVLRSRSLARQTEIGGIPQLQSHSRLDCFSSFLHGWALPLLRSKVVPASCKLICETLMDCRDEDCIRKSKRVKKKKKKKKGAHHSHPPFLFSGSTNHLSQHHVVTLMSCTGRGQYCSLTARLSRWRTAILMRATPSAWLTQTFASRLTPRSPPRKEVAEDRSFGLKIPGSSQSISLQHRAPHPPTLSPRRIQEWELTCRPVDPSRVSQL